MSEDMTGRTTTQTLWTISSRWYKPRRQHYWASFCCRFVVHDLRRSTCQITGKCPESVLFHDVELYWFSFWICQQTASEELVTPRTEEISASRREELMKLFLAQAPTALSLVQNVLDTSLEKAQQVIGKLANLLRTLKWKSVCFLLNSRLTRGKKDALALTPRPAATEIKSTVHLKAFSRFLLFLV